MRQLPWFVTLLLLSLLVSACAQAAPTPAAAPAPAAAQKPAAPAASGDLVIAYNGAAEPANLDAHIDAFQETGLIDSLLTDSLVCQDPKTLEYKPWLATSWETSADGLTWTFKLRNDVKFQDGTPFNAEAVKVNIQRILAPETKSLEGAQRLGPIKSVDVVDTYTVKMTHERPFSLFLDAFAILHVPIWSPTALKQYSLTEFPKHLIGTGPFKFKENLPKDHVTVVRNPDYNWAPACVDHKGPALLNSITFKWIAEASVRGGILTTGEAQVAQLPAQFVDQYETNAKFTVLKGYQPGTGLLWHMNTKKAPLDDIKVRQALLHTIDRKTINDLLYKGRYMITSGPMMPITMCYWKGADTMYPLDPAKAKTLLDEAGWKPGPDKIRVKDGKKLQLRWTAIHHKEMGEALKAQFADIGVDLTVELVPAAVQVEMVTRRDFDLMYYRLRNIVPVFLDLLFNSKNAKPGGYAMNGFADAKLDDLLNKAESEVDANKRCQLYTDAQKIIMDNALVMPMLDEAVFWGFDNRVKGFALGPSAWMWYPYSIRLEN